MFRNDLPAYLPTGGTVGTRATKRNKTERFGTIRNDWERLGTIGNDWERLGTIRNAPEIRNYLGRNALRFWGVGI